MKDLDIKQFHTEHKIIICTKCDGSGVYKWDECIDYHKGNYETYEKPCDECNGTGRIFETKKWHLIREPFDSKKASGQNIRRKLK